MSSVDDPIATAVFVLDTSTVSQAFRAYPKGIFPSFWQIFDELALAGGLTSVHEVKRELDASPSEIVREAVSYLENLIPGFFPEPTAGEQALVKQMTNNPDLSSASNRWVSKEVTDADPYVVARGRALAPSGIVVTEESQRADRDDRIPSVCRYHGLRCINLNQMMGILQWRF